MDFLDSVGALNGTHGRLPRTGASAPGPRRTRRGLRISRPRPALHRRGPVSSVARGPRQRRRLRPFLASRTASVGALRAPNRRRPRTSARARSARRKRSGLRISRPRPALHRRGPVSSVARASAIAAAPASLSRVSQTASVIARDRTSLVCSAQLPRAGALTPRAGSSYVAGRARFGPLRRRRRKRARSAMRTVSYYIRCDAATCSRRAPPHRKHSKLAPLLSPPPPRCFGQELLETSDLSIRRPYSELAPCRAARGELRGQSRRLLSRVAYMGALAK